jgi:proline iminopeptidase
MKWPSLSLPVVVLVVLSLVCVSCSMEPSLASKAASAVAAEYFDHAGRADVLSGGVRMIPIHTQNGDFRVWTKRVGNNPRLKVLLLHGGPGATHEYLEGFDSFLPAAGVEYFYYDQLGSAYSDQPDDAALWNIPRFVDEVEQVRVALGLSADNFVLLGQSWGGILAMEYALAHPKNLKGLVISNMMSSVPAYNAYADRVLKPGMDPKALAEVLALEAQGRTEDPHYEELLVPYYEQHLLRMPSADWPEPVVRSFSRLNRKIYVPMQGPSEMGASGILEHWDRSRDLGRIAVPTLVIGARYDTMDPAHMEWMSKQIPGAEYLYCPQGSHLAMYDDQQIYMAGLVRWLKQVEQRR